MSNKFIPHTEADIKTMLDRIGLKSVDDLYSDVPQEVIFKEEYDIPSAMTEIELRRHFEELGKKNSRLTVFAGGGAYDHYSPAAVAHLLQRSEFYTAYTPYQPEISQGTLQYIFEYQSMISELTGMEATNASMYDGATATAEAMFMMVASAKKRNRVVLSGTLTDAVIRVVETYAHFHGISVTVVAPKDGVSDQEAILKEMEAGDVAGVIVPCPNRYGIVEDFTGFADKIHALKGFLTINADPSALAVLRTPAEWGADAAVGDGQTLGMPLQFGGPYLGYISCSKTMLRKMPGRVVGATKDIDGKRGYVLTLQAREQHIRREKATSNICSNQGLMTLYASIYMSLTGAKGLREIAMAGHNAALYLLGKMTEGGRARLVYPDKPFLNEFLLETDYPAQALVDAALDRGILAGIKVADNRILMAATEMQTRGQIDLLAETAATLKN